MISSYMPVWSDIVGFLYPLFFFLAILGSVFLFWRASRHELMDSGEAFDLVGVSTIGALVGARLFDFFGKTDPAGWQLGRFIFFNRYGSFDFYGAIVGLALAVFIFLRSKKISVWFVLDLAAAPLAFFQMLVAFGSYLARGDYFTSSLRLWQFAGYLFIFILLKRLAERKRHAGLFFCVYLVSMALLEVLLFAIRSKVHYFYGVPYELAAPVSIFILAIIVWYILGKRDLRGDVKWFFGFGLLSLFRSMRMLRSTDEAGKFSKSMIVFPYYLVRTFGRLSLAVAKEIRLAILELLYVFGVKKFIK